GKSDVYSGSFALQAGERKLTLRHTPHKASNKGDVIPDTHLYLESYEIAGPERSPATRRGRSWTASRPGPSGARSPRANPTASSPCSTRSSRKASRSRGR